MANQRGQDGSVTIAAIALDELRSWSLDGVALDMIDDTSKAIPTGPSRAASETVDR